MNTRIYSARHVVRRMRTAFRHGDLTDKNMIKDALAWCNFLDSISERQQIAKAFHRLEAADIQVLPHDRAKSVQTDCYCCGAAADCNPTKSFHWVDVQRREMELPTRPDAGWVRSPMRKELIEYAQDLLPTLKRRVMWLSDLNAVPLASQDPFELLADLGQMNQQLTTKRRAIVYTVKVDRLYKPTYADAGFVFFWRAWSAGATYGMTRSLRDNRAAYMEWVAPKDVVRVVDAWPLPAMEISLKEVDLPEAFWSGCMQEIKSRCTSLGLSR